MSSPAVLSLACQTSNPACPSLRNISASSSWPKTSIASSPPARSVARTSNPPFSFLTSSQYAESGCRPDTRADACSVVRFARFASLSGAGVSFSELRSFDVSLSMLFLSAFSRYTRDPPPRPTGHLLFLDGSRFLARRRRGHAAEGQPGLGEPDRARVQNLSPPKHLPRPLVGHLLQHGRLDHELALLDYLLQRFLLL